jgi:hypothetical protein
MIRNPYAKEPPRDPNASNTVAASPAAKRPRPCSSSISSSSGVENGNGNDPSATTTACEIMHHHLNLPARPPTRVGGTNSVSRLVQPTSHVVPGQRRLAEHNNYAHHASSRPRTCGGNGNNNRNSGMDDDGGIDWDAALLQLDATSSSKTTSSTAQSTTTTGSGRLIDLTDSLPPPTPPNNNNNHKTRSPAAPVMTAASLTTAGLVKEKPPLHLKAVAASSPSLAAMQRPAMLQRPTAWTTGAAMSGSPGSATSNSANITQDPRQASLPQVLQFDSEKVKAVADGHRAQLVKHANLSSPLLNGWTLYSHQKKAILRGLLMRRMILALDMGLGYVKCNAAQQRMKRNRTTHAFSLTHRRPTLTTLSFFLFSFFATEKH